MIFFREKSMVFPTTNSSSIITKTTTDEIMKISVDKKKPVGNGIITCLNKNQAIARGKKGKEAANAIMSVLSQKK